MFHWKHLIPWAFVVLVGCGPRAQVTGSAQETAPAETVKTTLEQLAKTGQVGSEAAIMMQALEEMKATDAAKAEALLKDADQLMSLPGPAAVKAKAKEMLATLEGAPPETSPEEGEPEEAEAKPEE
jgi:hypothetical protein